MGPSSRRRHGPVADESGSASPHGRIVAGMAGAAAPTKTGKLLQMLHICMTITLLATTVVLYRGHRNLEVGHVELSSSHNGMMRTVQEKYELELEEVRSKLIYSESRAGAAEKLAESARLELQQVATDKASSQHDIQVKHDHEVKELQTKLTEAEAKVGAATSSKGDGKSERSRQAAIQQQLRLLREATSKYSRALIKHEFGDAETFRIQFTLRFPESMEGPREQNLIVETAPVSLVPQPVYYFMKQAKMGLWDGCSFFRNAGHVLQATPRSPKNEGLWGRFKRLDELTESTPSQEFDSKYGHQKYTLGLAGRPGGPDFYISTADNIRNHGPGGQTGYTLKEEADAAFARVIEKDDGSSVNVVKRMHTAETLPGGFREMKEYIEIVKVTVLVDEKFESEVLPL